MKLLAMAFPVGFEGQTGAAGAGDSQQSSVLNASRTTSSAGLLHTCCCCIAISLLSLTVHVPRSGKAQLIMLASVLCRCICWKRFQALSQPSGPSCSSGSPMWQSSWSVVMTSLPGLGLVSHVSMQKAGMCCISAVNARHACRTLRRSSDNRLHKDEWSPLLKRGVGKHEHANCHVHVSLPL